MRDIAQNLPEPVLIVGDFNTVPSKEFFPILLDAGFVSTRLLMEFKQGYDDILISESWRDHVRDGNIIYTRYSDHPTFWIDLQL